MNITSSPQSMAMRYALPQQGVPGERMMSGGRHKKEIKRRTKTGCLTCRKRRIKVRGLRACLLSSGSDERKLYTEMYEVEVACVVGESRLRVG